MALVVRASQWHFKRSIESSIDFMRTFNRPQLFLRNGQYRPRSTKTKTDAHQDNGTSAKKVTTETDVAASKEQAHLQLVQVLDHRLVQLIEEKAPTRLASKLPSSQGTNQTDFSKRQNQETVKHYPPNQNYVTLNAGQIKLSINEVYKGKKRASLDDKLGIYHPKQAKSRHKHDKLNKEPVQPDEVDPWIFNLNNFKSQMNKLKNADIPVCHLAKGHTDLVSKGKIPKLKSEKIREKSDVSDISPERTDLNSRDDIVSEIIPPKGRLKSSKPTQKLVNKALLKDNRKEKSALDDSGKLSRVKKKQKHVINTGQSSSAGLADSLIELSEPASDFIEDLMPESDSNNVKDLFQKEVVSADVKDALTQIIEVIENESSMDSTDLWSLVTNEDIKTTTEKFKTSSSQALKKAAMASAIQKAMERISLNFNTEAKAYVDACIFNGVLNKAHLMLVANYTNMKNYTGKRRPHMKVVNVDVYNSLIHAWAKQKNRFKIDALLAIMEEIPVQRNLQTYAALIECEGINRPIHKQAVSNIMTDMREKGFDVEDLYSCRYELAEWCHVKEAIQLELPEFPFYENRERQVDYKYPLAKKLREVNTEGIVNPYAGVLTDAELHERFHRQMALELDGMITVPSILYEDFSSEHTNNMRKKLEETKKEWAAMLKTSFERNVIILQRKCSKAPHIMSILPYLKLFTSDFYVKLMMHEVCILGQEAEKHSPPIAWLQKRLGQKIYEHYLIQDKIRNNYTHKVQSLYEEYAASFNCETQTNQNLREKWEELWCRDIEDVNLNLRHKEWPTHVIKAIGRFLYNIILYDTKIDANIMKEGQSKHLIPTFYSIFRKTPQGTSQEEVKPHPALVRLYAAAHVEELQFMMTDMPSLVPPLPWTTKYGGNMMSTMPLARFPDGNMLQYSVLDEAPPEQLHPIYDSLNSVSACAWKINKPVLDVIIDIFKKKGNKELDIPPPSSEGTPLPKVTQGMTLAEKSAVYRDRAQIRTEHAEMHSLWCTELYRLSIANMFRDSVFWFAHNMDFRGRYYPIPPHFNHLGSDIARSILVFAKGKPLGEKGLDWLKIHLVNLTGLRKRSSNSERLKFADEMLPEILDSADNPLTGNKWWQKSDEPWQTLACCQEIANVVRSHDPAQYISSFPVHQDGSCNGLQHYAALGRDKSGAQSVNLHPCDTPQDVYSDIVQLVEEERRKDAAAGHEIAKQLEGFVQRKVIKQTVMTTVYGVTKFGARLQINRQLEDLPSFPAKLAWGASWYLTDKTFFCLQKMFTSTKQIQDWFTMCANLISGVSGEAVQWVTPLGLPVMQPYMRLGQIPSLKSTKYRMYEKPNNKKQMNGFPPNFIHSLDSTHMMLTSLYCLREGITFVSVHDCFWTHAVDVPIMNKVTREQFVSLHSQPILEDLSTFMLDKFGYTDRELSSGKSVDLQIKKFMCYVLQRVPQKGSFELDNVLKSTYFFS